MTLGNALLWSSLRRLLRPPFAANPRCAASCQKLVSIWWHRPQHVDAAAAALLVLVSPWLPPPVATLDTLQESAYPLLCGRRRLYQRLGLN